MHCSTFVSHNSCVVAWLISKPVQHVQQSARPDSVAHSGEYPQFSTSFCGPWRAKNLTQIDVALFTQHHPVRAQLVERAQDHTVRVDVDSSHFEQDLQPGNVGHVFDHLSWNQLNHAQEKWTVPARLRVNASFKTRWKSANVIRQIMHQPLFASAAWVP